MRFNERFRGFLPVVIDVETGGVNPTQHALLELSLVLLEWEADQLKLASVHAWEITPHPATIVTEESIKFTQINPNDTARHSVAEEHAIRESFRLVRRAVKEAKCQRALLTGHNAHFDHQFVFNAARRNKVGRNPFHPFTVLDTASLSALALGHTVLSEAVKRLGMNFDENAAHTARYDAQMTASVLCEIVNRFAYSAVA